MTIVRATPPNNLLVLLCATCKLHEYKTQRRMAESLEEISPAYFIKTPEFCVITVLEKGKSFPYTTPSFPVFTVMLREAKLQWEEDGTAECLMDLCVSVDFLSIHFLQLHKFIMGT